MEKETIADVNRERKSLAITAKREEQIECETFPRGYDI